MTSVDDGFPLVESALVRYSVEVAALGVSEGRRAGGTGCRVADPVPPPLPQTVLPPVLWTAETVSYKMQVINVHMHFVHSSFRCEVKSDLLYDC